MGNNPTNSDAMQILSKSLNTSSIRKDGKPAKAKKGYNHDFGGHRQRLRDRYLEAGIESFSEHEILEVLLFYCYAQQDTKEIARCLIKEFGSLYNVLDSSPHELSRRGKITLRTAILISLIMPVSKRYATSRAKPRTEFADTREVGMYAISLFAGKTRECFFMICLDTQQKLIRPEQVADGTIDGAHVFPRTIVETALKHKASYVIIAHNHPSNHLEASKEDMLATENIMKALHPIGIEVLDHIIVGNNGYYSFREKGHIE